MEQLVQFIGLHQAVILLDKLLLEIQSVFLQVQLQRIMQEILMVVCGAQVVLHLLLRSLQLRLQVLLLLQLLVVKRQH